MLLKKLANVFVIFQVVFVFVKGDSDKCHQGFFKKIGKVQGLPDKNIIVSLVVSSWYECMKLCSKKRESCSLLAYSEVIQERSSCYLYAKDLENSSLKRNLNLITYKGSKEENWQVYELMEITSETCLKKRFCQNSVRCLVDSCEPEGYRCECDDLHYGKKCDQGKGDFELSFPEQGNDSYIFIQDAIKSTLVNFTFVTWFKTSIGLKEYRLLTYIVNNISYIEILFKADARLGLSLVHIFGTFRVDNNLKNTAFQPVNDNVWHHVAFTWSQSGDWLVFIDGKLFATKKLDHFEIPKGGNVYIGKYPGLNVAQNASGFIGKLSRLHLWDRVLLGEEIEEMAKRPNDYAGNVIDWYKFAEYIIGDVMIIKPSTAVDTDQGLNFQINIPSNSSTVGNPNYISFPVLKVQHIISACFWMRTWLHAVYISQKSEDGKKTYFAFGSSERDDMFVIINNKEVNSIMQDEYIAKGDWHFYCMSWNGKNGHVQFFFDGNVFGGRILDDKLHGNLSKAGNISVGFEWPNEMKAPKLLDERYFARISYLNLWSVELPVKTVKAMSAGGFNIKGDVMAWRDVQNYFVGNLVITNNTDAYFPDFTASKKRSEWCNGEHSNSSFLPFYARFGSNKKGSSMKWRCYCECALAKGKFRYNDVEKSTSYYSHGYLSKIF